MLKTIEEMWPGARRIIFASKENEFKGWERYEPSEAIREGKIANPKLKQDHRSNLETKPVPVDSDPKNSEPGGSAPVNHEPAKKPEVYSAESLRKCFEKSAKRHTAHITRS
jgi:hypothetical protein